MIDPRAVFPDGAVPATAGAGLVTTPRNRGRVEEDAPGQKEETEGQRGEGEGKNVPFFRNCFEIQGKKMTGILRKML